MADPTPETGPGFDPRQLVIRDADPARHEAAHAVGATIPALGARLRVVSVDEEAASPDCLGLTVQDVPPAGWQRAALLWLPILDGGMQLSSHDWKQLARMPVVDVVQGFTFAREAAPVYADAIELVAGELRSKGIMRAGDVQRCVLEVERARNAALAEAIGARQ